MKIIELNYNPSFKDLENIYDENADHKEEICLKFTNGMKLYLQRKYTYKGSNVVKTNYLHGTLFLKDGRVHSYIKQQKDKSFKTSSYYR